jgi:flagellar FliL protein
VVNLAGEVQHYLQVGIELKVADGKVGDAIKAHLPEIRNGVLLLLSSKQVDELGTLEGKNRLRQEIRLAVNTPLGIAAPSPRPPAEAGGAGHGGGEAHAAEQPAADADAEADGGVQDVLLTSFVIQ